MVSAIPGVDVSANPFIAKVLELQKNSTPYIFLVGFRYEQPTGSSLFQSAAQDLMVGKASAEETCQIVQDGIASYYEPSRSNFCHAAGGAVHAASPVHLFNHYTRRQEVPP